MYTHYVLLKGKALYTLWALALLYTKTFFQAHTMHYYYSTRCLPRIAKLQAYTYLLPLVPYYYRSRCPPRITNAMPTSTYCH